MVDIITTNNAPAAIGSYSQATKNHPFVFLSGQIGLCPGDAVPLKSSFEDQVLQIIKNLQAVCQASGGDLTDIVKLTVYLTDMINYKKLNEIMVENWPQPYPARALVAVTALPGEALVEFDGIMFLN